MNILKRLSRINCFVFDIDGVLTNGLLYLQNDGTFQRAMNIKDGFALQHAVKRGYQIIVLSGGNSKTAAKRLELLGIKEIYIGLKDKEITLSQLINKYSIDYQHTLYMGDDMPDLAAMSKCGIKACPEDACNDILEIADYISPFKGGKGCVRDVIEKVLKIQDKWY